MSNRKRVTRGEFHEIKSLLRDNSQFATRKKSGRAQSTVCIINQTKSLGEYLDYHKESQLKSITKNGVQVVPVGGAKKAKELPKPTVPKPVKKKVVKEDLGAVIRALAIDVRDNTHLLGQIIVPVEDCEEEACTDPCCVDEKDPLTRLKDAEGSIQRLGIAIWVLLLGIVFCGLGVSIIFIGL